MNAPHFRAATLPAVLTLLAGCAHRPPPPPAPPPPPPVSHTLDGVYRGTATRYRAERRTCPPPGLVTFQVYGGGFDYSLGHRGKVAVTIAPDRTLSGTDGDFVVTGQATEGRVRGHVDSGLCGYEFVAVRKK